jgi:hypothetical protein
LDEVSEAALGVSYKKYCEVERAGAKITPGPELQDLLRAMAPLFKQGSKAQVERLRERARKALAAPPVDPVVEAAVDAMKPVQATTVELVNPEEAAVLNNAWMSAGFPESVEEFLRAEMGYSRKIWSWTQVPAKDIDQVLEAIQLRQQALMELEGK